MPMGFCWLWLPTAVCSHYLHIGPTARINFPRLRRAHCLLRLPQGRKDRQLTLCTLVLMNALTLQTSEAGGGDVEPSPWGSGRSTPLFLFLFSGPTVFKMWSMDPWVSQRRFCREGGVQGSTYSHYHWKALLVHALRHVGRVLNPWTCSMT